MLLAKKYWNGTKELLASPAKNERGSEVQMPLYELAQALAVFVLHVHKLDAAAIRADITNHGGEMDFAEARAHFQLDGIADAQAAGGFQVSAAQADGTHARGAHHLLAAHLRAQGRFERDARITARHHEICQRGRGRLEGGTRSRGSRTIFHERQSILGNRAEAGGLDVRQTLASASEMPEQLSGFGSAQATQSFD